MKFVVRYKPITIVLYMFSISVNPGNENRDIVKSEY